MKTPPLRFLSLFTLTILAFSQIQAASLELSLFTSEPGWKQPTKSTLHCDEFCPGEASATFETVVTSVKTQPAAQKISSVEALLETLSKAPPGAVLELAEGTYRLPQQILISKNLTLKGAGIGKTILTNAENFMGNPATLPDPEIDHKRFDRSGYLIRMENDVSGITISDMTLTGPKLHGAIFGIANKDVQLHHLHIEDFMYSGIRTYTMQRVRIHDCTFVNPGMRWEKGQPGLKGGITGGAVFGIWMSDTEIFNCRFLNTRKLPHEHFYGIKGRQGKRCRFHHNTIDTGFSIEFPFENDEDVEIDHNVLSSTISIPKHAGGPVPASGRTFHIHHNVFRDTYSIEFVRNGVEISHNVFDFATTSDGGNLISAFGDKAAKGPALMHNNLISNPGRGIVWMNEPYANFEFRNNHVIARTTKTPRLDGLFGFHPECDFKTFRIMDNIIECQGTARPLFRNDQSGTAQIQNNQLTNITDLTRYQNAKSPAKQGLEKPLKFNCGVNGETMVDGWKVTTPSTPKK
jgi:hypothetical protein